MSSAGTTSHGQEARLAIMELQIQMISHTVFFLELLTSPLMAYTSTICFSHHDLHIHHLLLPSWPTHPPFATKHLAISSHSIV